MILIAIIVWFYIVYYSFLNRGVDVFAIEKYTNQLIVKPIYAVSPLVVVMYKIVRYHYQWDYGICLSLNGAGEFQEYKDLWLVSGRILI